MYLWRFMCLYLYLQYWQKYEMTNVLEWHGLRVHLNRSKKISAHFSDVSHIDRVSQDGKQLRAIRSLTVIIKLINPNYVRVFAKIMLKTAKVLVNDWIWVNFYPAIDTMDFECGIMRLWDIQWVNRYAHGDILFHFIIMDVKKGREASESHRWIYTKCLLGQINMAGLELWHHAGEKFI